MLSYERLAFAARMGPALLVAGLAAMGAVLIARVPLDLSPGDAGFRRLVGGATPSGRIHQRAVVSLPGLARSSPGLVSVRVSSEEGERTTVRYAIDDGPLDPVRPNREGELVLTIPAAPAPGARLVLAPDAGAPPLRLRTLSVRSEPSSWRLATTVFLVTLLTTGWVTWKRGTRAGVAVGLTATSITLFLASPVLSWWTLPAPAALARLLVPLVAFAAALVLVYSGSEDRRFYWRSTALLLAVLFGGAVRLYFLPSAGSWDTEYWKAWMTRSVAHGVTRVYGDPDATPEGHFWSQLLGREDLFQPEYRGGRFVVDYPPLTHALLRWSWKATTFLAPGLDRGEAENVAVKLLPVVGDVLAVVLLLILFREEPRRGVGIAALYWFLPVSWLSSAVLGFLDAAYAPFAAAALAFGMRGKAGWTGAMVAIAALIKPQALLVVPAAAVALVASGTKLRRAVASGVGVVTLALVPYAVAGTLEEAVAHVFRILFQQRLSAGFANPWWIVGHVATVAGERSASFTDPVAYASFDVLPFSPSLLALPAFAVAVGWICWRQRSSPENVPGTLAGGGIVFSYAMLALGVHENHPHAMFLLLVASGLVATRHRWIVGLLSLTYVLNMLSLSVLGRFYGTRYMAIEPWVGWLSGLRMALGFDVTLLLACANVALFAAFVFSQCGGDPTPAASRSATRFARAALGLRALLSVRRGPHPRRVSLRDSLTLALRSG